ncbi:MAG TPA: UDP-N-acetylmuramate--L-alanine ligase, partial [Flavobacteriaceae bacterium]|nr:UDP-N-acetylmuramate--L-alanine ligase [Flavobacteriaceae bacterium]
FIDYFASSLSKFDELILLDIYPAREKPIEGVTSEWLLGKIDLDKKQISSKENVIKNIKSSDAKIIVMIGAGDIGVLINEVKKELER